MFQIFFLFKELVWSDTDEKINCEKLSFKFEEDDTILCIFNPFTKTIKFTKKKIE